MTSSVISKLAAALGSASGNGNSAATGGAEGGDPLIGLFAQLLDGHLQPGADPLAAAAGTLTATDAGAASRGKQPKTGADIVDDGTVPADPAALAALLAALPASAPADPGKAPKSDLLGEQPRDLALPVARRDERPAASSQPLAADALVKNSEADEEQASLQPAPVDPAVLASQVAALPATPTVNPEKTPKSESARDRVGSLSADSRPAAAVLPQAYDAETRRQAGAAMPTAQPASPPATASSAPPTAIFAGHEAVRPDTASESAAPQASAIPPADIRTAPQTPANPQATTAASDHDAVRVPLHAASWDNHFAEKVVWLARNDQQSAQINITPPQLGPIQISLNLSGDQASAVFASPHAEVRQAIESAMPQLRDMLASAGISLGNTSVGSQMPQQNQPDPFPNAPSGGENAILPANDNTPENSNGMAIRRGRGLVDLFA